MNSADEVNEAALPYRFHPHISITGPAVLLCTEAEQGSSVWGGMGRLQGSAHLLLHHMWASLQRPDCAASVSFNRLLARAILAFCKEN